MTNRQKGVFLAILCPCLWGIMGIFVRTITGAGIGVVDVSFFRCAASGLLLLLFFALTALLVRTYKFGRIPGGFNQDGAMAAIDALALADHGTDHYGMSFPVHLTAWGYGQMSALLSYLMVPFIKLMGLSPVSAGCPSL